MPRRDPCCGVARSGGELCHRHRLSHRIGAARDAGGARFRRMSRRTRARGSVYPPRGDPMANQKKKPRTALWIGLAVGLPLACVAITGLLAAVALPAFLGYVKRAKTAEAESNLRMLFAGAASYYAETEHCTVGPSTTNNLPGPDPSRIDVMGEEFQTLGFSVPGYTYFQYEIVSNGPSCDHPPGSSLYTFVAHGDLDGDGVRSRFELAAGTDSNNELYRAPGLYIEDELE
jgi:type IV pilus assembly protein PilA